MENLNNFEVETLKIDEMVLVGGGCSFAYDVGFGLRLLWVGATNAPLELAAYSNHCS